MRALASLLLGSVLLTLPAATFAQDATPSTTAGDSQAGAFVNDVGTKAIAIMKNGGSTANIQTQLEALFNQVVDVDWVAKFVMGRNWRALTPEQQQSYLTTYRTFLIKHYTSNFTEYTQGTTFKVLRTTPAPVKGEEIVSIQILRPGKPPVNIDYRVRNQKVIDIAVEGVSLITTQRQEFASVMQRYDFNYLLTQLQQQTEAAKAKATAGVGGAADAK